MMPRQKGDWPRSKLSDVEAVWVATVIDCEGMLSIHTPWNKQRKNRNLMYLCRVQMTDEAVVKRLGDLCGGSTRPSTSREKEGYRKSWYWNITANGLPWLLPQLMPYLIVKKRHAEIAMQVLSRNSRGPGNQMSFEELRPLLIEIRSLQKSGPKASLSKIRCTFRNQTRPKEILERDVTTGRIICMRKAGPL